MTNIENLFSTKEEVLSELKKRWEDKELGEKLHTFLSGNIPEPFLDGPRAVLARSLISFDNETKEFYRKGIGLGLKPIGCEYLNDKFTTTNHGKACLGRVIFYHGLNKKNEPVTTLRCSIDLSGTNENKKFRDIVTLRGESFVDFHHKILHAHCDLGGKWGGKWG